MDLWEIFGNWDHLRIHELEDETSRLKAANTSDRDRLHDLNQRVTQLSLACAAMWELLKRNTNLSEDDLKRSIEELRSRGIAPPGASPDYVYCPPCAHKISSAVNRCVYCGAAITSRTSEAASDGTTPFNAVMTAPTFCPECRHEISATVSRCVYCGATVTPQEAM
jgi:hypothetical protein